MVYVGNNSSFKNKYIHFLSIKEAAENASEKRKLSGKIILLLKKAKHQKNGTVEKKGDL